MSPAEDPSVRTAGTQMKLEAIADLIRDFANALSADPGQVVFLSSPPDVTPLKSPRPQIRGFDWNTLSDAMDLKKLHDLIAQYQEAWVESH